MQLTPLDQHVSLPQVAAARAQSHAPSRPGDILAQGNSSSDGFIGYLFGSIMGFEMNFFGRGD